MLSSPNVIDVLFEMLMLNNKRNKKLFSHNLPNTNTAILIIPESCSLQESA